VRARPSTNMERLRAARALRELRERRLLVVLVPAPVPHFSGHKVRAVVQRNPEWYQAFVCGSWTARGGCLKRARIARALERVRRGFVRFDGYEERLLRVLA
jgi:hypothetical protein